jgi:hypothetical protein
MLIFILDSPLDYTLVRHTRSQYCSVFENFDGLNHACVATETPCRSHLMFAQEIISKIHYF